MTPREYLQATFGRKLKTGSLGIVAVTRAPRGRGWEVFIDPSYDGRPGISYCSNKDDVRAEIARWAAHRTALLGLDIGSYSIELPVNFGPITLTQEK